MKSTLLISCVFAASAALFSHAQSAIEVTKRLNYEQPQTPRVSDNYLFSTYSAAGKQAYNLKGFPIAKTSDPITSLKVNPAGASYALLSSNGKRSNLKVLSSWQAGDVLHDFGKELQPTAMTYSADSRALYVCDVTGKLSKYDSKTFYIIESWDAPAVFTALEASGNGYFLAGVSGNNVYIINPETKNLRTTLTFPSPVTDIDFSKDASLLAVLTQDGAIDLYDTRTFTSAGYTAYRQGATSVSIHPDNKYVAVAKNGNEIELYNVLNSFDNYVLNEPDGNITFVRFLQDGKANTYLTYNGEKMLKYRVFNGLTPNYTKLMRDEVMARMEEWSRMRPYETEEEYAARMTEESRMNQIRLFEEEIATRMADDLLMHCDWKLGAYNPTDGTLALESDKMPPVFITVPEDEMGNFLNPANLEFRNAIYGITNNDKFELVYADVYNRVTGKTYTFNNRDRKSLDYLYASDDFVPIELVKQTGMQGMALNDIRNSIVDNAMRDNLISTHTHIDVNTAIVGEIDGDGRKITNYKVGFKYTVDGDYSSREDFPAGKYKNSESPAASSMLRIIKQAFESDFAQYIRPGKKVIVKITGSADALPITGTIAYDGLYGEFEDEPYRLGTDLSTITLTKRAGIKSNEQLAFTRALAVKDYITGNVRQLDTMNTDYQYTVEVSDKKGSEFRRIEVEFIFVDAF